MNISIDGLFEEKQIKGQLKKLNENGNPNSKDFETVHIISAPLVNIRSNPSVDGSIIMVVEKGVNLEVIAVDEKWSKVRALGKVGWVYNELFKSEILEPE